MSASITNQHAKREVEFMGFMGLIRRMIDPSPIAIPPGPFYRALTIIRVGLISEAAGCYRLKIDSARFVIAGGRQAQQI